MAKRKAKDDGFNTSVPDLIAQFRDSIKLFLNHPAIPSPWPAWVPSPAHLDWRLNQLEEAQRELHLDEVSGMAREPDPDLVPNIKRRDKIRRELKTDMAKRLRYVEQALTGSGPPHDAGIQVLGLDRPAHRGPGRILPRGDRAV